MTGIGADAAVYRLSDEVAVLQTVDYITPVVNDPHAFGRIAVANALSDIYAMGGTPAFALNLVGFPVRSLPLQHLEEILRGGAQAAAEAGVIIAGGHSIEDNAPKYGLSVTGFVHPRDLVTKSGARAGNLLFLTKPLGSGLVITALDHGFLAEEWEAKLIPFLVSTNRGAARALRRGVTACTDVSGFGLLGHLHELTGQSGLSARLSAAAIPLLFPEIPALAGREEAISLGLRNNLRYAENFISWRPQIAPEFRHILSDPQTSGGLLLAVSPAVAGEVAATLTDAGCSAAVIGELVAGEAGAVSVGR